MFYEDLKKLCPVEFKRYCGVKPKTFERMVGVVGNHREKRRRKSGQPAKLSVADEVLLRSIVLISEAGRPPRECERVRRSPSASADQLHRLRYNPNSTERHRW
jgi:hypothetical protein